MFRFTIRDLLLLIALTAMGLGWWVDIRRRDSSFRAARLQVEEAEFRVDRARAETQTVREQAAQRERELSMNYLLERAKTDSVLKAQLEDPALRAEWEKLYPNITRQMALTSEDP